MVITTERTSVQLTGRQIESLDEMVDKGIYPNASEAIRAAVALLEDKHGVHGKPSVVSPIPAPIRESAH